MREDAAGLPEVSVVVPCRDAEAWIADAVSSAVSQVGVSIDLVVVDDGSRDRSSERAREAASGKLTLIRQEPAGVSRARNAGTAAARALFIQYLDADDVLRPGTLAARVAALEKHGGDVAYCDWVRMRQQPDGQWRPESEVRRRLSARPEIDLIDAAWWPPGALLYRRTLVDRLLPWREDLPVIQDARFQQDAAIAGATFVHVPAVGLEYRVHGGGSLSSRDPLAFADDCYRNASELHQRFDAEGTLDRERRRALARAYSHVLRTYFSLDRARFDAALVRVRQLDPHFLPDGPLALRWLSRAVGYRAAEHVAAGWRAAKAAAGRSRPTAP
jgi:glycosyltransferase involved in cell wall biosynthesis